MNDEKVLVTIAARGGSKGVKGKNTRILCGKPLIAHTILQAKAWSADARVICTTDSEEIAETAKKYGADVPFLRPDELATDTAGKIPTLRHALKECERLYNEQYAHIVDLDVTSPIRRVEDINGAFCKAQSGNWQTVFSVTSCRKNPYFNMVELQKDGTAKICKPSDGFVRRQDAPEVFDMNASIYVYKRDYLLDERNNTAISSSSTIWEMPEYSAFDIDNETDFQLVEFLVSNSIVVL